MEKKLNGEEVLGDEIKELRVDDVTGMDKAIREGFVGVSLIRVEDKDNRENKIIFRK